MNKKNKVMIFIGAVLVVVIGVVLVIVLLPKENEWIPVVQGSQVIELTFRSLEQEYKIEKYTDFNSFSSSDFADYNFIAQKTAKEERYSAEFFKTRDLIVIMFNGSLKGVDYTITDVKTNGDDCTVELLAVKQTSELKEESTTYGCFVETSQDASALNVDVKIIHDYA